jgi:RNA polymerase sigma-70 factor, ECF subfamily
MDNARHEEFARIFIRYQDQVHGYIVTMLPNWHDAEDVFQQTSLALWQTWDRFDLAQDFLPWACGVARNMVRNFLRRHGRDRVVLNEQLMFELSQMRIEEQPLLEKRGDLLAECIEKMPAPSRKLLEQCYAHETPMKAIAEQLHMTPNALYLRLRRIRRELMECIDQGMNRQDPS